MHYAKPWLDIDRQISLLEKRGLIVNDKEQAKFFLSYVNYYRFSGYCLAFQHSPTIGGERIFKENTLFEDVQKIYLLDRGLRDAFSDALELIEISLRSCIAYNFGHSHGAFGHTMPENFLGMFSNLDARGNSQFAVWKEKLKSETNRSRELFVKHFANTYDEYPNLPIWILAELCSFGSLSKMLTNMLKPDVKNVAALYKLQPDVIVSWTHTFSYLRNVCAHHSRLWDKNISIIPRMPVGKHWNTARENPQSICTATMALDWMLSHGPIDKHEHHRWQNQIIDVYRKIFSAFPHFKSKMKFSLDPDDFQALLNNT